MKWSLQRAGVDPDRLMDEILAEMKVILSEIMYQNAMYMEAKDKNNSAVMRAVARQLWGAENQLITILVIFCQENDPTALHQPSDGVRNNREFGDWVTPQEILLKTRQYTRPLYFQVEVTKVYGVEPLEGVKMIRKGFLWRWLWAILRSKRKWWRNNPHTSALGPEHGEDRR